MNKGEARSAVMEAISMALKDPILQQGFEIICKENVGLEKENAELKVRVENQKSFLKVIKAKFVLGKLEIKEIEGYLESEQLTKAKEYIKLLLMNCVDVYESTGKTIAEIQVEAEQFLNSEVEK